MGLFVDPDFGRGELLVTQWPQWLRRTPSYLAGESVRLTRKVFPDVDPSMTRGQKTYSNEMVVCVAVKNTTNGDLAVGSEQSLDGYTGIVDEYLSKPVQPTEIFWLVIKGLYSTDLDSSPVTRARAAGGPDGTVTPTPPDTTIGSVTVAGDAAADNGDGKQYSATVSGDASGLTYAWECDGVVNSIESGNSDTCTVNFGGTGTATVKCVVGSTDPTVTDGPTKQAEISVTVS